MRSRKVKLGDDGEIKVELPVARGITISLGRVSPFVLVLIVFLAAITGICSCGLVFQLALHGDLNTLLCQTLKMCVVILPSPNPLEATQTAIGMAQTQTA